MNKTAIVLLLLPVLCGCFLIRFFRDLPRKCPSPSVLQSNFVKTSFEQSKMDGFWYELAMKDCTQPRMCSCQTSNKIQKGDTLYDEFSIQCYNKTYFANLTFALQQQEQQHTTATTSPSSPGVMMATWHSVIPLVNRIVFPNTVVDVEVNAETGNYEWMIEFQCIQGPRINIFGITLLGDWIAFYAFNFYSRTPHDGDATKRVQVMEARARQRGIGPFIDHWSPLKVIDHSNCLYGH